MSKLFFINLKANLTTKETKDYFEVINNNFETENNHFVFFINHLSAFLSFNKYKFDLGIQSFFQEKLGAFSTCNTLEQIQEFSNLKYCLLGHCEELKYFNLSLNDINLKIKSCLRTNIIPVICFGNDSIKPKEEITKELLEQIEILLLGISDYKNTILAYEPKYVVNSSVEIIPEEINELFIDLKNELFKKYKKEFSICYGGNVNKNNINEFTKQKHIDGFLIGRYGLELENIKYIKFLNK